MSNYFPEDVLGEVLSRLPVKSLKRFKCVSKRCRDVIESDGFIKIHLDRSSSRIVVGSTAAKFSGFPESYVLCSAEEYGSEESFLRTKEETLHDFEYYPDGRSKIKNRRIKVIGSCNGLVCVRYSKSGVLLWNPWIRKQWILPLTNVETELFPGCKKILHKSNYSYGFGYDELNDDYKVVRMVQLEDINNRLLGCEVKVFSMKTNSWRRIQDFPYTAFRGNLDAGVLANGSLHWILSNYESNPPDSIVAIDLATDEHRLLPTPEPGRIIFKLTSFCGKLCFCANKMWVMEENSWKEILVEYPKYYTLYVAQLVAYSERERNFIFENGLELMWFNHKRSVGIFSLPSSEDDGSFCDVFCCVPSLVEPNCCGDQKKMNCEKKDSKPEDVSLKRSRIQENRRPKKRGRTTLISSC